MSAFVEDKQEKKLTELRRREAEELAQVLARHYGLPYLDLSQMPINADALSLIPEKESRANKIAAFRVIGKELHLALTNPETPATKAIIDELKNKNFNLSLYLVSLASLERAWGRYGELSQSSSTTAGIIDINNEKIAELASSLRHIGTVRQMAEEENSHASESGISSLLEIILAGAIALNASDIHLEPEEERVRLRYRLDGVLNDITFLNQRVYTPILSRLKIISGLKLNIRKAAQDGRFSIKTGNSGDFDIRSSVLPGAFGESVVLRLLNPATIAIPFAELGVEAHLLKILEREIKKPNGLILLTGPTGAGKTTTLYAFLREINQPGNKVITIEDPIEYHLEGINQTQVDPKRGYSFLSGLRSALRQDPDVIMVGEIRDAETASIAINSSLTGHLVLSTLHSNDAWGTIPRLIDLKVNPKVIEAALNIAIAQRLVRRLCPQCRVAVPLPNEERNILEHFLSVIGQKRPDLARPMPTTIWAPPNTGNPPTTCEHCHGTGYRGRIGIFEALLMAEGVSKLLTENPSARELRAASRPQGILEMAEDGIMKVIDGTTTLGELKRVVDLDIESINL